MDRFVGAEMSARVMEEPYFNNLPILFARLSGNQRSQGESYLLTVPEARSGRVVRRVVFENGERA